MRLFTVKYISYSDYGCETSTLKAKDKSESFFDIEEAKECLKYNFAKALEEDSEMIREYYGNNKSATINYKDGSYAKFEIDNVLVPTPKTYADMFRLVDSKDLIFTKVEIAYQMGSCLGKEISDDDFERLCDYLYKVYLEDESKSAIDSYVYVVNDYMDDENKYTPADIYNGVSYQEFLDKVSYYC